MVMYETHGSESRGVELLSNRDVRAAASAQSLPDQAKKPNPFDQFDKTQEMEEHTYRRPFMTASEASARGEERCGGDCDHARLSR